MRIPFALVASLALAPMPAHAQFNNPAALSPGSTPQHRPGVVKMHEANAVDRLFVQLLTQGGLAEVEAGATAVSQSRSDPVRSFGQWMREAHRSAQDGLEPLAKAAGIPLPTEPSDEQKAQLAQLRSTDDAAFDAAYLQQQLIAHQKTVNVLMWEIDNGQDPALTGYAAHTLRDVTRHLEAVQLLMSEFANVVPQGLGATMPLQEAAQWRAGGRR